MSDGNDTDASGQQSGDVAALRAQMGDIAETLNVVAGAVSDLDHRIQLAQAATTTADQRWEQRITTIEARVSELDAALRAETEQVRGSTSVIELLSHEIRASLSENRDMADLAGDLREAIGSVRQADAPNEFAALRGRLDDFDGEFSAVAATLTTLQTAVAALGTSQLDSDAVLSAMQRIADRQPDLAPIQAAIERVPSTIPDLSDVIGAITARDDQLSIIRDELLALRSIQPDLTPVLDALQDLRDRQVDLTPVHSELRELRGAQPDINVVVDAIDEVAASLPSQFRELEGRLPDLSAISAALDRLAAREVDLEPVLDAIEAVRVALPDVTPLVAAAEAAQDPPDLSPLVEEIQSLGRAQPDLRPIVDAVDGLRAQIPDLQPTNEAIAELRVTLGDTLLTRVESLIASAADRQQAAADESLRELRAVDDQVAPLGAALTLLADRIGGIEQVTTAHAASLADQSGELITLREQTHLFTASTPASASQLDELAEQVRSIAQNFNDSETVSERIRELSGQLDGVDQQRLADRADLTESIEALALARGQVEALVHAASEGSAEAPAIDIGAITDRIETILSDNLGEIDRSLAARHGDHLAALSGLIADIPDPTSAINALSRPTDTAPEVLERLEAIDRTVAAMADAAASAPGTGPVDTLAQRIEVLLIDNLGELRQSLADSSQADPTPAIINRIDTLDQRVETLVTGNLGELRQSLADSSQADPTPAIINRIDTLDQALTMLVTTSSPDAGSDVLDRLDTLSQAINALSAAATDAPASAPIAEITERVEALLKDSIGDIDRSIAARQFEHQSALAGLIESIPDATPAIDALLASTAEQIQAGDTTPELLARLDALSDRTDAGLHAVRESIEDRLATLDQSRSSDAEAIRTAVEHVGSQERLLSDRLEAMAEQIAASTADSDALWVRASELLIGVDRVASEHRGALAEIGATYQQLADHDDAVGDAIADIRTQVAELHASSGTVDAAITALAATPQPRSNAEPGLSDAIQPLSTAVDALAGIATEHRERLDTVARSIEAFTDRAPDEDAGNGNLERRIDSLLDRQADLLSSVRELHPRIDELGAHDPREALQEVMARLTTTEADVGVIAPKLETLIGTLDRTEERISAQTVTLDRVDVRAERLGTAVAELTLSTERLGVLDDLAGEITSLSAALGTVDAPALTAGLADLAERVDGVRSDVSAASVVMLERVEASAGSSNERLALFDERAVADRDRSVEQMASLEAITAEVVRDLGQLRGDLQRQGDGLRDGLEAVRVRSDGVAESVGAFAAGPGHDAPEFDAVIARLDAVEQRLGDTSQSLTADVGAIRQDLGRQLTEISAPLTEISNAIAGLDFNGVTTELSNAAREQQLASRDASAATAATAETNESLRNSLLEISGRVAELDLDSVRSRLETLEGEQRASEQRLAASLSSVHAVVDSFEIEPVLSRLDSIETHAGESESGLYAAIAEVRTAALSIDLSRFDSRIAELEQRNQVVADGLSSEIRSVIDTIRGFEVTGIESSLSDLGNSLGSQRDEFRAAVDELSARLDLGVVDARLEALDQRANESASIEAEVQSTIRTIAGQLGTIDLRSVEVRLDQLVETVRATDEASRTSLADEIGGISRRISELDTEQVVTRLGDLTSAHDRLSDTVTTELAATVDRVRSAVTGDTDDRISGFADAAEARDRDVKREIQALRETVLDQFSSASSQQRQSLVDRIDTLGNTVVDRLDDTRLQTDSLAAQVSSIHGVLAADGSSSDIRAHVDSALESLAERIGAALRDLRREVTDIGNSGDMAGLRSTFETALDRLGNRFDTDFARVLEALSGGDETDRLRRIDSSITEMRRDFEVLRRLSDQTLSD